MKLPEGIKTSSPRSTPQIKTLQRSLSTISITDIPLSRNSGSSLNFNSSTLPFAKVSSSMAEGKRSKREISIAEASSGLIIIVIPRLFRMKFRSLLYKGFRTLAMVWHLLTFFAITQHKRFNSSDPVTAMSKCASSIPASDKTLMLAPLSTIPITSMDSESCCIF